jgi:hypothetical protein
MTSVCSPFGCRTPVCGGSLLCSALLAARLAHTTLLVYRLVFGTVYYNGVLPTIAMSISFTVLLAQTSGSIGLWASYISFIVFGVANTLIGSWNAEAAYEMVHSRFVCSYFLMFHAFSRHMSCCDVVVRRTRTTVFT